MFVVAGCHPFVKFAIIAPNTNIPMTKHRSVPPFDVRELIGAASVGIAMLAIVTALIAVVTLGALVNVTCFFVY